MSDHPTDLNGVKSALLDAGRFLQRNDAKRYSAAITHIREAMTEIVVAEPASNEKEAATR